MQSVAVKLWKSKDKEVPTISAVDSTSRKAEVLGLGGDCCVTLGAKDLVVYRYASQPVQGGHEPREIPSYRWET